MYEQPMSEPVRLIHPPGIHPVPAYLSPASRAGGLLYIGGQVALDPSGQVTGLGDIRLQTRQALANLQAVLDACGAGLRNLAGVTVYLRTMADFEGFNEVYAQTLDGWNPPRTTVQAHLVDPDFLIEIQALAVVDDGGDIPIQSQ